MNRSVWTVVAAIALVLIAGMVFGASATADVLTPCAIIVVIWQLVEARRQGAGNFEDGFSREYRTVISALPAEALFGRKLSKEAHAEARPQFFRYFDLCNHQSLMFEKGRIAADLWTEWLEDVGTTIRLPAFARAWAEIKAARPDSFEELRRVEANGFVLVHEAVPDLLFPAEPAEETRQAA